MNVVGSQRPLTPLYRPGERFDISAAGLQEWYRSDCFRRVAEFYTAYPQRSLFADNGRALLHHMIVMLRPDRVLEIGTMYAGTTEVLAKGRLGGRARACRDARPLRRGPAAGRGPMLGADRKVPARAYESA
ncbi:MAG: hypothetical protein K2X72_35005 [Reyranella sp.]|nr:hypothetical protein [Reyranella sp.]